MCSSLWLFCFKRCSHHIKHRSLNWVLSWCCPPEACLKIVCVSVFLNVNVEWITRLLSTKKATFFHIVNIQQWVTHQKCSCNHSELEFTFRRLLHLTPFSPRSYPVTFIKTSPIPHIDHHSREITPLFPNQGTITPSPGPRVYFRGWACSSTLAFQYGKQIASW